jgi:hypothetical protein
MGVGQRVSYFSNRTARFKTDMALEIFLRIFGKTQYESGPMYNISCDE